MSTLLIKLIYLVKLSTKGGGGQYVQKMLHMVCAWSLRLIKEIVQEMCEITGEKISIFFHFQSISIAIQRSNLPNHLLVEPRHHHGDGSKIALLPWSW